MVYCNSCKRKIGTGKNGYDVVSYYHCKNDEDTPCDCNFDLCQVCLGCPNGHIWQRYKIYPNMVSQMNCFKCKEQIF